MRWFVEEGEIMPTHVLCSHKEARCDAGAVLSIVRPITEPHRARERAQWNRDTGWWRTWRAVCHALETGPGAGYNENKKKKTPIQPQVRPGPSCRPATTTHLATVFQHVVILIVSQLGLECLGDPLLARALAPFVRSVDAAGRDPEEVIDFEVVELLEELVEPAQRGKG